MTIPGPTVQPGWPLKVSVRSDPGAISESLLRIAICAAPTATGWLSKALKSLMRTLPPPMLVRTIIRTV
jgi:hypothetical protein